MPHKKTGLTATFSILLKTLTVLNLLLGIGFIAFGCALEAPPTSLVPVGLVIVGVLTILSSSCGYMGARFKPKWLLAYLIMGTFVTVWQLIIVLGIFIGFNKVVDAVVKYNDVHGVAPNLEKDQVAKKLDIGKWILLWVILGELAGLILALVMRCFGELEGEYDGLTADQAFEKRTLEMQNVRDDMDARSSNIQSRKQDKIAAKMDKKYGAQTLNNEFRSHKKWYNIF
ncbi:hypothetical protein WJX72_001192 [[Myrmecia] bisecta]|uniref:Uncharacterized protein n=1 Tax=[Myrmecia] bisecta TaxID=41462 RepID=A0AAW1R4H8_9CHLO